MSEERVKIPDNVYKALGEIGELVGKAASEDFDIGLYHEIINQEIKSPIEQLFLIAIKAMCLGSDVPFNPDPYYSESNNWQHGPGLHISMQKEIGKYRADFLVWQEKMAGKFGLGPIVVELDGHDFHDRDKRQRSYEKARDRFFVKEGYRVMHYTGSDVVANPLKVAFEVMQMLGIFHAYEEKQLEKFDATDPFFRGW